LLAFLALVVAVIAIVIAVKAKTRLEMVERALNDLRARQAERSVAPQDVAAPPAPAPAPVIASPVPQPAAVAAEPPPPPPQPPRPAAPAPAPAPAPAAAASRPFAIDWENVVGIKLFSWIAGIALVLAAVFLFKYSVDHGWLRPPVRAGIGLVTGIALLIVCELRLARNYQFTANAMHGAGIAILYATLFAMHQLWRLIPAGASFVGMILVTAAAVYLSTRRESVFIALLGLIGGFATPALLSSGENRPLALFSYLLLLNGGMSWIAYRKRWPLLTALSVALTTFYQWGWISKYLDAGQLPLAAGIFAVFALVGAASLWDAGADRKRAAFTRIAQAAAVLPLLFAFFTAVVPEYGARVHVLFGFLLLMACGLAAIALWRGPEWLHALGGLAVLLTWLVWLTVSYTAQSWPWPLVWLAAFIALYLAAGIRLRFPAYTAALLFLMLIGLAAHEPAARDLTLAGATLALLVPVLLFSIRFAMPVLATIALAFSSIAVMVLDPALHIALPAHVLLFIALMAVASIFERHFFVLLAVPFFVAALIVNEPSSPGLQLLFGTSLYALFAAYALLLGARAKTSLSPFVALVLTSAVYFGGVAEDILPRLGYGHVTGGVPLALCGIMLVTIWRYRNVEPLAMRTELLSAVALAFFTIAIPEQFDGAVVYALFTIEALALAWLYTGMRHRGLLLWSGGLIVAVLSQLAGDRALYSTRYVYFIAAACMFLSARVARDVVFSRVAAAAGTIVLFARLNIEISEYYAAQQASLAKDLTYTIAWAVFAIAMLIVGLVLHERGARVAALGLLLVTVLKCFLHDLAQLGGLYRVASLFGLAVSLVLVGMLLQKFVIAAKPSGTAPAPNGTT
jgi:Predicted membrane protein (DUF2339)